jgi:hypothetical protein
MNGKEGVTAMSPYPSPSVLRAALPALLLLVSVFMSGNPARAGESTFSVDAPTVQSFLEAVTPYEVMVGKGGLSEILTLANPREIRFQKGRILLKLDCRGEPFPIEMVLEPAITVEWDEEMGAWMARIASFPIEIPLFGKFDLARYLRPYPIPQHFSQPAGNGEVFFSIDGKIKGLQILEDRILVNADLTFRHQAPPEDETAGPEPAPTSR